MIRELREQLREDLATGLGRAVDGAWPDRVSAPAVFLVPPANSYVSAGSRFKSYTVRVDVVLLVGQGSGEKVLAELEDLIETVLRYSEDWALLGVDAPSTVNVNGQDLLGTIVHLGKESTL